MDVDQSDSNYSACYLLLCHVSHICCKVTKYLLMISNNDQYDDDQYTIMFPVECEGRRFHQKWLR